MTTSIHYGSLAIPRSARALVDEAFAYLGRDAGERSIIQHVERSPVPHRLVVNHRCDDSYAPDTQTIRWDPTCALRTAHGGRQSPALGLGHELDHAAAGDDAFDALAAIRVPRFDNVEELRVILGSERQAARTLHESVRANHGGRDYRVASPIDR